MKSMKRSAAPLILFTCFAMLGDCGRLSAQTKTRPIVLKGALLIDGTGRPPIENSVIVIDGGKIRAVGKLGSITIPNDADVRDLAGKTVMPGLVNLHGHLGATTNGSDSPSPDNKPGNNAASASTYREENVRWALNKYLSYGVETIASFGTDGDLIFTLRDEQHAGKLGGARLFTAGRGFTEAGPNADPNDIRYHPKTPEEAREEVREVAAHHPDYTKMWVDDAVGHSIKLPPAIYQAIIDEAHRHNIRAFAHEYYLADGKALLAAGIDGFAHSIRDQPVDNEFIQAMKARDVFLIPTLVRDEVLFIYADGGKWLDDPFFQAGLSPGVLSILRDPAFVAKARSNPDLPKFRAGLEMGKRNLKTLYDAGVKIGFGTDSGLPNRFPGYFEHRELQLMVEAGLTPMQAIVAATLTNAGILRGAQTFGTLQPGRQADLLVLDANPLDDIHNTEKLSAVWQAGKVVPSVPAKVASAKLN